MVDPCGERESSIWAQCTGSSKVICDWTRPPFDLIPAVDATIWFTCLDSRHPTALIAESVPRHRPSNLITRSQHEETWTVIGGGNGLTLTWRGKRTQLFLPHPLVICNEPEPYLVWHSCTLLLPDKGEGCNVSVGLHPWNRTFRPIHLNSWDFACKSQRARRWVDDKVWKEGQSILEELDTTVSARTWNEGLVVQMLGQRKIVFTLTGVEAGWSAVSGIY